MFVCGEFFAYVRENKGLFQKGTSGKRIKNREQHLECIGKTLERKQFCLY